MKTQLIMLDNPIIVSDEGMKDKDGSLFYHSGFIFKNEKYVSHTELTGSMKIIAGFRELPQIDWNDLESEFGWVDVEKCLLEYFKGEMNFNNYWKPLIQSNPGLIEAFKKAQELNKNKFSLEDIEKAYQQGRYDGRNWEYLYDETIRSLQQPKVFDIGIEMEYPNGGYSNSGIPDMIPKITNNKIKILKKL